MSARRIAARTLDALGSFGLACIVLLFLLLLTFLGTIEQASSSLYDVQKKYFESLFVVDHPLRVPLPGAYLLLALLFANLIVGGMLRLRRSWSRAGVFTIHIGIAALLIGGFVEFRSSRKGHLTLFEGENGASFKSYYDWEVVVIEPLAGGRAREHVISHGRFKDLGPQASARFLSTALPFEVELTGYLTNCRPRTVPAGTGVDGFAFEDLGSEMNAEANIAGITVVIHDGEGARSGLLWGVQTDPWTFRSDGRTWQVDLRKRSWELPFTVHLRDFTRELHPGTGMASKFYSDVTCLAGNVSQDLQISMNEPLRRDGFTLYQTSWGPRDAREGDRLFSTFAVVENPADRVPMIACLIIAIGLLVHFVPRLGAHVKAQTSRATS